jgi:hypothetical protein
MSKPDLKWQQYLMGMIVQECLQITDYEIQRSLLKKECKRVFVLVALVL